MNNNYLHASANRINIAVVGVTGLVGETILEILEERKFPIDKIYPIASARSKGNSIIFNNQAVMVHDLADFNFSEVALAFFAVDNPIAAEFIPRATSKNCVVIDNSSAFRYDTAVPLIVPEVNINAISQYKNKLIIANPNCSTIQMVTALKPLYDTFGIKSITVSTYQSVSGKGKDAIQELVQQSISLLGGNPIEHADKVFPQQIGFNIFPHVDDLLENRYTKEEMKMILETKKIMADETLEINPTTVRVPVFYGHSLAVTLQLKTADCSLDDIIKALTDAPGVTVVDPYITPATMHQYSNDVYVGRVRKSLTDPSIVNLWVVADNIRKGAALNSIQIAEALINEL